MDKLTERELEVLKYIVAGMNNQEISNKLCISNHTTKAHVSNIYKKLGVTNRVLLTKLILEDENFNLKNN